MNDSTFIDITREGNKIVLAGSILFSLFWLVLFVFFFRQPRPTGMTFYILVLVFLAGFAGPLITGLREMYKERIAIRNHLVTYEKKGWLRVTTAWTEPLSGYHHLLKSVEYFRRVPHYKVTLVHDLTEKNILLDISTEAVRQRERSEKFALDLELPVHEKDPSGNVTVRKHDDTGKNISEKSSEGTLSGTYSTEKPPDWSNLNYHFAETVSGFQLVRTHPGARYWAAGLFMIAVLITLFTRSLQLWNSLFFIAGLIAFAGSFTRHEFEIDRENAQSVIKTFGLFRQKEKLLPVEQIEEIKISQDLTSGTVKKYNLCVGLFADQGTIYIGHGLAKADLEWLQARLIQATSSKID